MRRTLVVAVPKDAIAGFPRFVRLAAALHLAPVTGGDEAARLTAARALAAIRIDSELVDDRASIRGPPRAILATRLVRVVALTDHPAAHRARSPARAVADRRVRPRTLDDRRAQRRSGRRVPGAMTGSSWRQTGSGVGFA